MKLTPYDKRLTELGKELHEQLRAEQSDSGHESVPFMLAEKIAHICGYIEALQR